MTLHEQHSGGGQPHGRAAVLIRVVPFAIFLILTACQGSFGEASRYWFYLAKTVLGGVMLWIVWPRIKELRLAISWEAAVAGVGVCVIWVGLDGFYPDLHHLTQDYLCPALKNAGLGGICPTPSEGPTPWNPHTQFGPGSALAWLFVLGRLAGSTLVVPALEEVFYRSFLYRYLASPDFEGVSMGQFKWIPFLVTSVLFGLTHQEWLAGILCGFIYQGLVIWKQRLGDAIVAHALTNLLLGLWVITQGAWKFW